MASLAEMKRELTVERTLAGLEVARQLGRKGGRKRQMTDSKIESAKRNCWPAAFLPGTWQRTLAFQYRLSIAGFQQRRLR